MNIGCLKPSTAGHLNGSNRARSVYPVCDERKVLQKCLERIGASGESNLCLYLMMYSDES